MTFLTTDDKRFLNEYEAVIHESTLHEERDKERRWDEMTIKIAELVLDILRLSINRVLISNVSVDF